MICRRFVACLLGFGIAAICFPATAPGDWIEQDGHKMHFPQLPDPTGWDVRISNARNPEEWIVADDWQCSETGWVQDVHFWVSWQGDLVDTIENIHLSIHDNIPVGPDGWSTPGDLRWEYDTGDGGFTIRHAGQGDQGWFDPPFDEVSPNDHENYYQINIVDLPNPFVQQKDQIYWLDVSVDLVGEGELGKLGWKTSQDHFMDDAVFWHVPTARWVELRDPLPPYESLDMAFVITGEAIPEPSAMVGLASMAAAAGLLFVWRRRRAHSGRATHKPSPI